MAGSLAAQVGPLTITAPPRPPALPSSVEGVVRNSAGNQPLAGTTVYLDAYQQHIAYTATTDAGGHFRIDDVRPGDYGVIAERAGFTMDRQRANLAAVHIGDGQPVTGIDVSLAPLGAIAGRVLDAHGDPIPGADLHLFVRMNVNGGSQLREGAAIRTDDRGQYRFFDLPAGTYFLRLTPHPEAAQAGVRQPGGRPQESFPDTFYPVSAAEPGAIELAAGAEVTGIDFRMAPPGVPQAGGDPGKDLAPGAVIAGRVLDPKGEPVRNVSVAALQYSYVAGRRVLAPAVRVASQSDDRGEYRIYGLSPGSYYLIATWRERPFVLPPTERLLNGAGRSAFIATYYPDAKDAARATPVALGPGEEKDNADLHLLESPVYTIRMPVLDMDSRLELHARGANPATASASESFFTISLNGVWTAQGVPPGSYILSGTHQVLGNPRVASYAHQAVEVTDHDVILPAPVFAPSFDVIGSVQVEGDPQAHPQLPALLPEGTGNVAQAVPSTKGLFLIQNVQPRTYQLRFPLPPGSYLKRVTLGDHEVPDLTLDFSPGPALLFLDVAADVGRVEGSTGGGAATQVVLAPDGAPRNLKSGVADPSGHYSFPDVPPGTYHLFAFAGAEPGAPLDPDFRRPYQQQSVEVKVAPGQALTVDIQPIPARR